MAQEMLSEFSRLFEENARVSILVELFKNKSMTLEEFKGNGRSTTHRHLKDLGLRGFVKKERENEFVRWSLNDENPLIRSLKKILCNIDVQVNHEVVFMDFFSRRAESHPQFTTQEMRNFYSKLGKNPPSSVHMSNLFSKFIKEGIIERTGQRGGFLLIDGSVMTLRRRK